MDYSLDSNQIKQLTKHDRKETQSCPQTNNQKVLFFYFQINYLVKTLYLITNVTYENT